MVLSNDDPSLREHLLAVLEHGGVAIAPCDTIYGFVGRVPDTEARIRRIKGRHETNPFLMLIGRVEQAAKLSTVPLDDAVVSLWPAPLTIVLPAADDTTVAIRLPDDAFLRDIVGELDSPIYSTSVNRSGQLPMWRIAEIVREFENEVDLVIDRGDIRAGRPSTILDVSCSPYRVLRQGAFEVPPELLAK